MTSPERAHLHGSGQDRACRGVLASLRTSRLEKNNSLATALGCPTQSISRLTAPREVAGNCRIWLKACNRDVDFEPARLGSC